MTLLRAGAVTAAVISFGLLILVLVRDVGLNWLNGWTIVLGFLAAASAVAAEKRSAIAVASIVLLILAMLPALIGGLGLLYLVPIVLIAVALPRLRRGGVTATVDPTP